MVIRLSLAIVFLIGAAWFGLPSDRVVISGDDIIPILAAERPHPKYLSGSGGTGSVYVTATTGGTGVTCVTPTNVATTNTTSTIIAPR